MRNPFLLFVIIRDETEEFQGGLMRLKSYRSVGIEAKKSFAGLKVSQNLGSPSTERGRSLSGRHAPDIFEKVRRCGRCTEPLQLGRALLAAEMLKLPHGARP